MAIDYSEILCQSIDNIVKARVENLPFDITKYCIVENDTNAHKGEYIVSDGSVRYSAYSQDKSYKKGNSVLVTIPNGDYNGQKMIVGRVAADDSTPFVYTSPMETMIKITNGVRAGSSASLLANGEKTATLVATLLKKDFGTFEGFTRIGLTADFMTQLSSYNVIEGTYGLRLLIDTKDSGIFSFDFTNEDMYGNPYNFENYFSQEIVFPIDTIKDITEIQVYFFQDKNFKSGDQSDVPTSWDTGDSNLASANMPDNLFVDNVMVYLGYGMNEFTNDVVTLYTEDAMNYHYDKPETLNKLLQCRWIHKVEDGLFELINTNQLDGDNFSVSWFLYDSSDNIGSDLAGPGWSEIPAAANILEYEAVMDTSKNTQEFKVVARFGDGENWKETYSSIILIFKNDIQQVDQRTYDASTALSIVPLDGTQGNYFIYNQNGKIIKAEEANTVRQVQVQYKGAPLLESVGKIDYIKWYVPYDADSRTARSMIIPQGDSWSDEDYETFNGTDYKYKEIKQFEYLDGVLLNGDIIEYTIRSYWNNGDSDNTIRCEVSIDEVVYEAVNELRFGKAGSSGTDKTFVIDFEDNKNALIGTKNDIVNVKAYLYDISTGRLTIEDQLDWSWYKGDSTLMSISTEGNTTKTITYNGNGVPNENYQILQCKYKGNQSPYKLTAYLPIPIKSSAYSHIEGTREVVYDHQGNPQYQNGAKYKLFKDDGTAEEASWGLYCKANGKDVTSDKTGYYPSLVNNIFMAPMFLDETISVCISASGLWSQPILLTQSNYDFALLNSWDGSLQISEEEGTILSKMVGAGKKNSDNTFSGVLLGDYKTGTDYDDADPLTGVYGFDHGKVAYAFKEDGTAFIGKNGAGQIRFDGNMSSIQSGNYGVLSNKNRLVWKFITISINSDGEEEEVINYFVIDQNIYPEKNAFKKIERKTIKNINADGKEEEIIVYEEQSSYYSFEKEEQQELLKKIDTSPVSTEGMRIDLNDGRIDAYNFQLNSNYVTIDSAPEADPYFEVRSISQKPLIKVGESEYTLQSSNYYPSNDKEGTLGNGTKLSLNDGTLDIRQEKTDNTEAKQLYISGTGSPFMKIAISEDGEDFDKNLLYIADTENNQQYYLQSRNYLGLNKVYFKYNNNSYPIRVSADGTQFIQIDNDLYYISGTTLGSVMSFDATQDKNNNNEISITAEAKKKNYLMASSFLYNGSRKGFKLDLNESKILGYDLVLQGQNSDVSDSFFILDSTAETTPFQVGPYFSVDWDGSMSCSNLQNLRGNNADIWLNEHFYVNGSGMGASNGSFGSLTLGGRRIGVQNTSVLVGLGLIN